MGSRLGAVGHGITNLFKRSVHLNCCTLKKYRARAETWHFLGALCNNTSWASRGRCKKKNVRANEALISSVISQLLRKGICPTSEVLRSFISFFFYHNVLVSGKQIEFERKHWKFVVADRFKWRMRPWKVGIPLICVCAKIRHFSCAIMSLCWDALSSINSANVSLLELEIIRCTELGV